MTQLTGFMTKRTMTSRNIFSKGPTDGDLLARGILIDGANARDPLNTDDVVLLRAGMLLGLITASKKWGASILGLVTVDYTSGGTELMVSPATAAELVRRIGPSGTFGLTHAPTEGGTVVPYAQVTYSAVDTETGVITITNIGANVETGAMLHPEDGSQIPRCILANQWGIKVTDDQDSDVDVQASELAVMGQIDVSKVVNYPAAAKTSYIAWLQGELDKHCKFVYSDHYK